MPGRGHKLQAFPPQGTSAIPVDVFTVETVKLQALREHALER